MVNLETAAAGEGRAIVRGFGRRKAADSLMTSLPGSCILCASGAETQTCRGIASSASSTILVDRRILAAVWLLKKRSTVGRRHAALLADDLFHLGESRHGFRAAQAAHHDRSRGVPIVKALDDGQSPGEAVEKSGRETVARADGGDDRHRVR